MIARFKQLLSGIAHYFGVFPSVFFTNLRWTPKYFLHLHKLRKQAKGSTNTFRFGSPFPQSGDDRGYCGNANDVYFLQDLFVASRIHSNQPRKHVDIGSRIDGFVAHVAAFREIEVFDIRKMESPSSNIIYHQADFMSDLPQKYISYCDSISSLHAMEHFGLGRYGDPIDYDGHLKGIRNMLAMLSKGGKCYFSVPFGEPRIEFNAHRVFSLEILESIFSPHCHINNISYIDDAKRLHENVTLSPEERRHNFNCQTGCLILEMTKR